MEDATLEFLATLDDPTKWVIRRGVPIFKPHKRTKPNSDEVLYEVTAADMPTIASNMAALEGIGVFGRITPGHVLPGNKEADQPSLYGFTRSPRAGTFGQKQEPCVLVDEYLYPATAEKAGKLPFRSSEYYPSQKVIRGVAKLIRDPYLDLGVVTYASKHGAFFSYESEANSMEPTPEEMAQIEALMAKFKPFMCQKYNLKPGEEPAKPGEMPKPPGDSPAAIQLHLNQSAQLYAAQNAAIASLLGEVKGLKAKSAESEIDATLTTLSAVEHYQFDAKAEKAKMVKMDDAGRLEHVASIRANYRKTDLPPGAGFTIPVNNDGGGSGTGELDLVNQAILYVRDNPGSDFIKVMETLEAAKAAKK